jgi:hypothetical protein
LTTASSVDAEASGCVPATVLDGGMIDLRLNGGEKGGLDCLGKSFSGVFPANARDLCVIVLAYGVLYVNCTSTADNQWSFQALRGHSVFKKKKKILQQRERLSETLGATLCLHVFWTIMWYLQLDLMIELN